MPRRLLLLFFFCFLCACKENPRQFNGYIDADLIYLSSNFPGRLTTLAVLRGQSVEKKQFLFKLEETSERYAVEISKYNHNNLLAQRQQIISQIEYDEINYRRTKQMRSNHAASQNDLDVAKRDLDVHKQQLAAIQFQIDSSQIDTADKQWQLTRKEGYAEESGIIFDTYYTKNEYIQAGQPVLSLLTKQNIKVIFFVPEPYLSKLFLNQKVHISSDGNPNLATGTIRYISNIAQYTSPLIYSREDREELVFRVEVGILKPNLRNIHLGQPVSLELIG